MRVERAEHRDRITHLPGGEIGLQRCVLGAITGLCMDGDPTGNIQHGNDLHP
jgi:hypothetical protein